MFNMEKNSLAKLPVMLFLLLMLTCAGDCIEGNQHRLYKYLFGPGYIKELRPVHEVSTKTVVQFGIALRQIISMDQPSQVLQSNVWIYLNWEDELLFWDPKDYDEMSLIIVPTELIWVPDITLYNNADEKYRSEQTLRGLAKVNASGSVYLETPAILKSSCHLDVTYFPFDEQRCILKFGSWAYNGNQLDLINMSVAGDLQYYVDNGEWDLLGIPLQKNIQYYYESLTPYQDLTFTIHLRRRSMFYLINLLLPCIMITTLTLLEFNLPCESGEKVTLGITILLSLTVFLLLVVEQMPPTSDSFPWIGKYFSVTLLLVCVSTAMTVVVLNIHYANHRIQTPPQWLRNLAFRWMVGFSRRPAKFSLQASDRCCLNSSAPNEMQCRIKISSTDDSSRCPFEPIEHCAKHVLIPTVRQNLSATESDFAAAISAGDTDSEHFKMQSCEASIKILDDILHYVKLATVKWRDEDVISDNKQEWREIAWIIDRCFMWLFVFITVSVTTVILFKAAGYL